jgi:microcin-processing metallopeptidase PmbA/TldD-like protein
MLSGGRRRCRWMWLAPFFLFASVATASGQQGGRGAAPATSPRVGGSAPAAASAGSPAAPADPVLAAMLAEMERSKTQLKMDNLPAPYYVEYHVADVDEFDAEAAFGALRLNQRTHGRNLRVVVRVGDYKQDSFGPGAGQGVADRAPLDNDPVALRRALWLATDRAYKTATQALASKKATQSQFSGDQGFDDFAHAQPLQSVGPLAKLDVDSKPWTDALVKSSALFRTDPQIETLTAQARFRVVNEYFVNSEGTVTRHGSEVDSLALTGSTQAADGMRLDRSPAFVAAKISDLPTPEQFLAGTSAMIASLKALRDAPMVEEDYRGPVLFAPDAAADIVFAMIGNNVVGVRPSAGDAARTAGSFASSYKSRVLPASLSVTDDPTTNTFQGKSLVGSYEVDDEGVRAAKVSLIENGELVNYLLGRQPIRDFPESNGHGRAAPGQAPRASIGNLILRPSQSLSPAELKKKLLDMCRDENKPYGYYAEILSLSQAGPGPGRGAGPASVRFDPELLYRVYVQDGHQELVRGAIFTDQLDTRSLRNDIVAAGNDPLVSNRATGIPTTVISPSILFDELEVRRTTEKNGKLPEYSAPQLTSSSSR